MRRRGEDKCLGIRIRKRACSSQEPGRISWIDPGLWFGEGGGGGTNGQLTRERESSSERVSVDGGERPGRRRCGMACGIHGLQ